MSLFRGEGRTCEWNAMGSLPKYLIVFYKRIQVRILMMKNLYQVQGEWSFFQTVRSTWIRQDGDFRSYCPQTYGVCLCLSYFHFTEVCVSLCFSTEGSIMPRKVVNRHGIIQIQYLTTKQIITARNLDRYRMIRSAPHSLDSNNIPK